MGRIIKELNLTVILIIVKVISVVIAKKMTVVTTTKGKVQGVVGPSNIAGKFVQKFLNIPYAEAPVGKLRFKKPVPKKSSNQIINNLTTPVACWQARPVNKINYTEDCLILNIWTPYPEKKNQSVMIWIHGGAFLRGDSVSYPGYKFVSVGDVILVTINYRLSALGFLTTGDDRIKGNFGLFDQRLAMKWVKENIASFGGNPKSITIFGESAGGASVSAHTLSEKSWPYFNKAILQSGVMTMPRKVMSQMVAQKGLSTFLQHVHCLNNKELLDCLQNNITNQHLKKIYNPQMFVLRGIGFAPYIDGDFLTNSPQILWNNGKAKDTGVILGVTQDEGFILSKNLLQNANNVSMLDMKLNELLRNYFTNSSQAIYDKAAELYPSLSMANRTLIQALKPIVDFHSDTSYICATRNEVNLRSQLLNSSNVYLYRYSYVSKIPPEPLPYIYPQGTFGFASHFLDVPSTIGFPINDTNYPDEDQILSMRIILYWTNFGKNGAPGLSGLVNCPYGRNRINLNSGLTIKQDWQEIKAVDNVIFFSDPNVGTTELPIVINGVNSLPKWPKFTNSTREYLDMESNSKMTVRNRLREKTCDFLRNPKKFIQTKTATSSTTEAGNPTTTPSLAVKSIAEMVTILISLVCFILS